MTQKNALMMGDPNPRKIVGLILAGTTIYALAKGKRVSPLAVVSAALTILTFVSE